MTFISSVTEHRLASCGFNVTPVLLREKQNFALHLCQTAQTQSEWDFGFQFLRSLLFVYTIGCLARLFPVKEVSAGCISSGVLTVSDCGTIARALSHVDKCRSKTSRQHCNPAMFIAANQPAFSVALSQCFSFFLTVCSLQVWYRSESRKHVSTM